MTSNPRDWLCEVAECHGLIKYVHIQSTLVIGLVACKNQLTATRRREIDTGDQIRQNSLQAQAD
jgi:hypothetical protein